MDELKTSSISYESDRPVVSDPKCEAVIKSDGNRNENKNVNFLRFMEELDAQIARFQHRRLGVAQLPPEIGKLWTETREKRLIWLNKLSENGGNSHSHHPSQISKFDSVSLDSKLGGFPTATKKKNKLHGKTLAPFSRERPEKEKRTSGFFLGK
ncbi:unnamed protein product [Citrullus colocynthis]|uniref:Uncharacterized protein n=1 Tax=Citrullus colocynthis TaxID=252529 RepID=A0ABP0YPJ7_9ROSI